MICYLTKLYVVIEVPPRNIKKTVLHNLSKAFNHVIIIPFLVYTSEYSKVQLEREKVNILRTIKDFLIK